MSVSSLKAQLKNNLILFAVLVVLLMGAFIFGLTYYIGYSVHNERSTYLATQIRTSANLANKTFTQNIQYAEMCSKIIADDLQPNENIFEYLDKQHDKLYLENSELLLIDSNCTWYGTNHTSGRVANTEYYEKGTAKEVGYITQSTNSEKNIFIFRVRFKNPIKVTNEEDSVSLAYCAISCDMDFLQKNIDMTLGYNCNNFIIDEQGLMLCKNFNLGILMGGSNILAKYARVDFLYHDDGQEQLSAIKNNETAVGEFKIDNAHYFIGTTPLEYNNWKICFVIPTSEFTAGSYLKTISIYVIGICLIFFAAILTAYFFFHNSRIKQNQLEKEKATNFYLEQASKAKSEFLSNMSHDIRTPINGIMGMTLLAKKENNPPKTEECLNNINDVSQHLLSLVNDVLDMSSIESGKVTISAKPLDIRNIVHNCVGIIHGQTEGRNLDIKTEFADLDNPFVLGDELHLQQILINILSNAVKYTADGGTIIFRLMQGTQTETADTLADTLIFEVEDNGIGMKSDFVEHIWDSFAQEDGGSRTQYKGTGLGMTITKNLVELMGGTIEVRSEYEQGSTFTVEIPFQPAPKPVEREFTEQSTANINGAEILLAEDNALNMLIAKELLEDEGAVITTAENGRKAVEIFSNSEPGKFDVILMDIMMPEMNGLEATKAIRSLDRTDAATVPIIAMTANAFEDDIQNSLAAGMNAHLSKPINLPMVLKTISGFYHGKEND